MNSQSIRVWDVLVRLFHWSLVLSFTVAYLSGEALERVHAYAGYLILGLLAFRLIWGIVGTRHARFSDFVQPPRKVIDYLKQLAAGRPQHYLGHNPAGGWMVVALLLSLSVTGWSGLELYAAADGRGPLASSTLELAPIGAARADDWDEHLGVGDGGWWDEIHEVSANLTLLLVLVHIAGVFVAGRLHRENLVKAMITGNKQVADGDAAAGKHR